MSDFAEIRSKLVDEAQKALHRKGIDHAPCSCPGRKRSIDYRIGRIEELSQPGEAEVAATPYLSTACSDCGRAHFYLLPFLIGVEIFNKIAGDQLDRIV